MRRTLRHALTLALLSAPSLAACGHNPAKPVNHNPVIRSLTVFPSSIGPSDSAIVTCNAFDADGDTLVYDWSTDLRLRIRGAPPNYPIKNNTISNSEVFYLNYTPTGVDSVYVACGARDGIGGEAVRAVVFTVHP